jgi:hypothetical protein
MRRFILNFAFTGISTLIALATPVFAQSPSRALAQSVEASIALPVYAVYGSAQMVRDSGKFSVGAVTLVGDVAVVSMKSVASGAEISVQLTAGALKDTGLLVGTVLEGSVTATGLVLVSAGKALIFIPNEVGQSLLHHSRAAHMRSVR